MEKKSVMLAFWETYHYTHFHLADQSTCGRYGMTHVRSNGWGSCDPEVEDTNESGSYAFHSNPFLTLLGGL